MNTFLVFGASGQTGKHFISLALKEGNKVKALVRNPDKILVHHPNLEIIQGTVSEYDKLDNLVNGVQYVSIMLGDAKQQQIEKTNYLFIQKLVPVMRKYGVKKLLYQAGGFTRKYKEELPLMTWILKNTLARFAGYIGQHIDNEAVIEYLVEDASDIEWIVHRAAISSDGPSKGVLKRSENNFSLATFVDCATYNYNVLNDNSAIHTCDLTCYS